MSSVIDVCNMALAHLGDEATVSSIDPPEGSAQAGHCARFYPMARDALLTMFTWSFATRRADLPLTALPSVSGWEFVYALPNNCLKPLAVVAPADASEAFLASLISRDVSTLFAMGHPDNYHQQFVVESDDDGNAILYTNVENAILFYIHSTPDTTKWTPLAIFALARLLAHLLAGPLIKGSDGVQMSTSMMNIFTKIDYPAATREDAQRRLQNVYTDATPSAIAARA